jgi:hypothetical protein
VSFWERRWAGLVAVALALALYAPTVTFGRVWLDDYWLWSDDSPLRHVDGHVLHDVFLELDARHPYGSEYLPVRDLVVAADMAVWGDSEHGPHVTQLFLFALVAFSLGTLLVRWGFPKRAAWLATLLWVAHPLCVQSVAWMSERKGMLAALCVLACGHAWVRFRSGGARVWLAVATLAAVCGVWSKAPAMFAVGVFGAWDLLLLKPDRRRWLQIIVVGVATALAAVPVVLVASRVRVIDEGGVEVSRVVMALGAQGHYFAGLLLARPPALSYPLQTDGPTALDVTLGLVAIAFSIALVWRRRGDKLVMAALAWAWIWFVPVSQLVAPVHIAVADRYAFLWTAGGCMLAALVLEPLSGTRRTAVTAALVGVLAVCTIRAEGAWASSRELFAAGVASNPRDFAMHQDLATAFASDGESNAALRAVDAGLAVLPHEVHLRMQRADLLWQLGNQPEALNDAQRAAETGSSAAASAYGKKLLASGRPGDALWWAERAARFHPELESYQLTLAEVCVALQQRDCAEHALRTAIAIPDHSAADEVLLERVRTTMPPSASRPSTPPTSAHSGR